jgi:acetolactate synthase-1/2/3 large subunit
VVGRSGTDSAASATRNADGDDHVGARFSDNHTAMWRSKLVYDIPGTKIIHVNVDAREIGRNFPAEVGAVADAGSFLDDLAAALGPAGAGPHQEWLARVAGWKQAWADKIRDVVTAPGSPIHPARLVFEAGEAVAEVNGRVLVDVGDTIQYAEPYLRVDSPDAWYINSGMAEMGWASSGVLGAVVADPTRPAVVLTGDGAFNMVSGVLATAVEYQLPAVWVVLNNHELGIERKGSTKAFERVHPWARFVRKDTGQPYNPDYTLLAEANGAHGVRVEKADEFAPALARAIRSGQPWVIDAAIDTSVPTFFTEGIDRAYPADWGKSYPQYSSMTLPGA